MASCENCGDDIEHLGAYCSRRCELDANLAPPTRAEFDDLAARVAALENPQGTKQPAATMPECLVCGMEMSTGRPWMRDWSCTAGPGMDGCGAKAVWGCESCCAGLCADHLPKPALDNPRGTPALNKVEVSMGTHSLPPEAGAALAKIVQSNYANLKRPATVEQPAQVVEAVTTWLDKVRTWEPNWKLPCMQSVKGVVGNWWDKSEARYAAILDQRTAVEAACKPLRERIAELENGMILAGARADKNAQDARELARLRELYALPGDEWTPDDSADWTRLLTKACRELR